MSDSASRKRVMKAIAGVVLALTFAACGSGSPASVARRSTTTSALSAVGAGAEESAAGSPNATTTVTAAPPAGGHAPAKGGPSGTATTPPTSAPTATHASQAIQAPQPVAAGTYRYRQTGKSAVGPTAGNVPAEGTLLVDAATGGGRQVFHRAVDPKAPPNDLQLLFGANGMFLERTVTRVSSGGQTTTFTCNFNPPVPAPPWPPVTGKAFSGTGDCGTFTAQINGSVGGTRSVVIDGVQRVVYAIGFTVVTHGQVESQQDETDWFSPDLRLQVHTESHEQGTYGLVSFSSDITADLESGRPT